MSKKKPAKRKKKAKKKTKQGFSKSAPVESVPSLRSMEGLLAGFSGMVRGKRTAVDEAQDIIYAAWEAPTRQRAVALARKALEVSPDCADAYNLLAEETAESLEEALDLYRKGVEAGERALGKKTFKEDVGHFWGLLETRPYMRARAGLAQCLWEAGQREEAVEHYWDMLRLNPNDNQGIRYLLMPCLIELGRDEDAEKLFKQYKEDGMAVWVYSRALLDFRKHGDSPAADRSLKEALEENPLVPHYLLGRKKIPRVLPDYYGFGDENEAVLYARGNRAAWKATPGALEWLAAKLK
ncbi:MAG: tetratricopeptide repeat protein [Deltaproteobacteria bacterium]|nr:tetratricopeptide repeat protein [Deltaproteobacteria bacterium]MBW2130666.1 tetratricopeptide repeat protein [Deltaproteobacteria bacterium]